MKNKLLKTGIMAIVAPMLVGGIAFANDMGENSSQVLSSDERSVGFADEIGTVDVEKGTNLNIRESYGTQHRIVGKIPAGKKVNILGKINGWYKVEYNGVEGYSSSDYIRIGNSSQGSNNGESATSGNGKVINISSKLNVRRNASTSSAVIGKLKNGQVVKLLSQTSNGWYKIAYNDSVGYVHGDYIVKTNEGVTSGGSNEGSNESSKVGKIATVTAGALNVRDGAGTSYSVVSKLYKGNDVKVLEVASNGWNKVKMSSGVTGWVTGEYLSNYRDGELSSGSGGQVTPENPSDTNQGAQAVINIAKSKLGFPYEWGAEGPNSFDCSGLTYYAYKKGAGVTLPRTSSTQASAGYSVSRSNLKPGDLVFFNTSGNGISHVGLYIGNDEMIHSPNKNDVVKISKINSSYYSSRFVTARRIVG